MPNQLGPKIGQAVRQSVNQAVQNVTGVIMSEVMGFGNPMLMQIFTGMQNGGDAIPLLRQFGGNTQQAQNAIQVLQGKSPEQLKSIWENMARSSGLDPAQIAQRFNLPG